MTETPTNKPTQDLETLFEFLLVLADPYIDRWSGGAPSIKLLFNAGIAALIFPAHAFFESKMKKRLVKK